MTGIMTDTEDKSVWTDKLFEITGKPRCYWARLPLWALKKIHQKELERKRHVPDWFHSGERRFEKP